MIEIDFKLFTALWNQMQRRKTPMLHLQMAEWLENCWNKGEHRMLLMAFREAGKSTIVGLFAAWLIYKNPNIRILVLAADESLAKKMVRNVKRIIERHPLTEPLKPANADQWASDRFTVTRTLELRDPTVIGKGVISNVTGSHADIVICDDVEVPNTCDSEAKREDLRERLSEIPYVLVAGGAQLYVGTPHHYYSIYADTPREEINEEHPFLNNFERLSLPILDKENKSAWPERYSEEDIGHIRETTGPNKFDSQMLLKPVNIMEGRLNPDLLQFYKGEVEYDRIYKKLFVGGSEMAGASCWWDPAFGSAAGDDSVCAVIYSDPGGYYYLQHLEYIKVEENGEIDEATQQAQIITKIAKEHYLPCVTVEINGLGRFLPNILRREIGKAKIPTRVQEVSSTKAKAVRIIEGFDALMASQRLRVHENVTATPFIAQMREWRPGGYGKRKSIGKDDALDAVAGALSRHPDRLEYEYSRGSHNWMQSSRTHTAKGQWDV